MPESILKTEIIERDGKKFVEVKNKSMVGGVLDKVLFAGFGLGLIIFIVVMIVLFRRFEIPLFFKIGFPVMILIVGVIALLGLRQNKNKAIYLTREGNKLHIHVIFQSVGKHEYERMINLEKDARLVLVKFMSASTLGMHQLLLRNGSDLSVIAPTPENYAFLGMFPIVTPIAKFLYTPKEAREISRFLNIPLEEKNLQINAYVCEFKKSRE